MTRENYGAALGAAKRAASLLTGMMIVVGLAGCESIISQSVDTNASLAQKAKPSVAFSPVLGVPQKYGSKVSDQLSASVKEKGVQVVEAKDAEYIIKAAYTALPEAKKGTKVSYAIDVKDKADRLVRRIEGEEIVSTKRGGESWSHVTDEGLQRVALKSSAELNAWIDNPNAPAPVAVAQAAASPESAAAKPKKVAAAKTATATPVSATAMSAAVADAPPASQVKTASASREATAIVPAVTGAPGDGKTALADAMKRALAQKGVKVASTGGAGSYKVQGQVEMQSAANGVQPITIRWFVTDPSGKQLEKSIVQNNTVSPGQLDATWGETAEQAAGAAAAEVLRLMGKAGTGQAQQGSGGTTG